MTVAYYVNLLALTCVVYWIEVTAVFKMYGHIWVTDTNVLASNGEMIMAMYQQIYKNSYS